MFRYEANLNGSWPNSQAPLCERQVIRMPDCVGISVDDIPLTIACAAFNSGKAKTIDEALAIVPGVHGIGCERVTKKK